MAKVIITIEEVFKEDGTIKGVSVTSTKTASPFDSDPENSLAEAMAGLMWNHLIEKQAGFAKDVGGMSPFYAGQGKLQ